MASAKVDPEMVTLAVQLVDRQTGRSDGGSPEEPGQAPQIAYPVTSPAASSRRKKAAPEELREQPAFKLSIAGGQKSAVKEKAQAVEATPPTLRTPVRRRRAS